MKDYGKCPVTGEPLSLDDIVSVKAGKVFALLVVFLFVVLRYWMLTWNAGFADCEA